MQEALLFSAMVAPPVIWSGVKLWGVFSKVWDEVDNVRHISRMRRLSEDRERAEIERLRSGSKVYVIKRKNGDPVILSPTALKRKAGQRLPSPAMGEAPMGVSVNTPDTDTPDTDFGGVSRRKEGWVWLYNGKGGKQSRVKTKLTQAETDEIWRIYRKAGGGLHCRISLDGKEGRPTVSGIAKKVLGGKGGWQNELVKDILSRSRNPEKQWWEMAGEDDDE